MQKLLNNSLSNCSVVLNMYYVYVTQIHYVTSINNQSEQEREKECLIITQCSNPRLKESDQRLTLEKGRKVTAARMLSEIFFELNPTLLHLIP